MDPATEAAIGELEREHARLQRLAAQPDPRQDTAAVAARRERRMRMTGTVERLVTSPGPQR